MEKIKKVFVKLFLFGLFLLFFIAFPTGYEAKSEAQNNFDTLDAVLLVDRSRSLDGQNPTDPKGQLMAAARFMVDIIKLYGGNSKGAIVYFGDDVDKRSSSPNLENYDKLVDRLQNPPSTTDYTCHIDGFNEALKILERSKASTKHIYLFTDGNGHCRKFGEIYGHDSPTSYLKTQEEFLNVMIPKLANTAINVFIVLLNKHNPTGQIDIYPDLQKSVEVTDGKAYNAQKPGDLLKATKEILKSNNRIVTIHELEYKKKAEKKELVFEVNQFVSTVRVALSVPKNRFSAKDAFPVELITPNGQNVARNGAYITTKPTSQDERIDSWVYIGKAIPGKWSLRLLKTKRNYKDVILYVDGFSSLYPEITVVPKLKEYPWTMTEPVLIQVQMKDANNPNRKLVPYKVIGFVETPSGHSELLNFAGGDTEYRIPEDKGSHKVQIEVFIDKSQKSGFKSTVLLKVVEPDPVEIKSESDKIDFGTFEICTEQRNKSITLWYEGKNRGSIPVSVEWSVVPEQKNGITFGTCFQFENKPIVPGKNLVSVNHKKKEFDLMFDYDGAEEVSGLKPGKYEGELNFHSDSAGSPKTVKIKFDINLPKLVVSGGKDEVSYQFWWNGTYPIKKRISVRTNSELREGCEPKVNIHIPMLLKSSKQNHNTNLKIVSVTGIKNESEEPDEWFIEDGLEFISKRLIPLQMSPVIIELKAVPSPKPGKNFDRTQTNIELIKISAPVTGNALEKPIKASYGLVGNYFGWEISRLIIYVISILVLLSGGKGFLLLCHHRKFAPRQNIYKGTFGNGASLSLEARKGKSKIDRNRILFPSEKIPKALGRLVRSNSSNSSSNDLIIEPSKTSKDSLVINGKPLTSPYPIISHHKEKLEIYTKGTKKKRKRPYIILDIENTGYTSIKVRLQKGPFKSAGYAAWYCLQRFVLLPVVIYYVLVSWILPSDTLAKWMYHMTDIDTLFVTQTPGSICVMIISIVAFFLCGWMVLRLFRIVFGHVPKV